MFSYVFFPWVHGVPASSPEYFWEAKMSGKIKWTRISFGKSRHFMNFQRNVYGWSWSCFRDSPGTPGMWSQTRKWVKTHGKTICFLVIKRSNIAFLKIIVFFWTSWTWWCCLCLDDPLYQPPSSVPRGPPTSLGWTGGTRAMVRRILWWDVGDIARIENDSWANLEFSEWPHEWILLWIEHKERHFASGLPQTKKLICLPNLGTDIFLWCRVKRTAHVWKGLHIRRPQTKTQHLGRFTQ